MHSEDFVQSADVMDTVRKLNSKTSRGADTIPNRLLCLAGPRFIRFFAIVINHMINTGYTPRMWKFALVVPIKKLVKSKLDFASYRPIALLSNLGKVWERVLLQKMNSWIEACEFFFVNFLEKI